MISKNKIKYIRSLAVKKNRDLLNVYVAEGPKVVGDILACANSCPKTIVATSEWIERASRSYHIGTTCEIIEVSEEELTKVSFLCHPQQVLAVFEKEYSPIDIVKLTSSLSLVLDGVQDPGNLGTIIRVADWFGIENVICSTDTVDVYNPKVVQATMGSLARVKVSYTNLIELTSSMPEKFPVYGTLLEGEDIYQRNLSDSGFIVMGNEGNGISPKMRNIVNSKLRIPNFPPGRSTADSLNVAIATAVVCAEFRRRIMFK